MHDLLTQRKGCNVARSGRDEPLGRMILVDGVALLHPEDAVFDAMLEGWRRLQRGGRRLQPKTIGDRLSVVRRFMEYANEYLWMWSAGDLDDWMTELIAAGDRAESTIRNYQGSIRQFCDYITSPYYQWPEICEER